MVIVMLIVGFFHNAWGLGERKLLLFLVACFGRMCVFPHVSKSVGGVFVADLADLKFPACCISVFVAYWCTWAVGELRFRCTLQMCLRCTSLTTAKGSQLKLSQGKSVMCGEKMLHDFSGPDYIQSVSACVSQQQHFRTTNSFSY